MIVVVRDSIVSDVYALAGNLRAGDRAEVDAFGVTPARAIRHSYRHAILRRTCLVDGEVAAMAGLCGAMLSDVGEPYLMTTPQIARIPVTFVKLARAIVQEMLAQRTRLQGMVAADYHGACRLLQLLGFTLGAPQPVGPRNVPFRSFTLVRR